MQSQRAPTCVACGAPAPAVLVPTTYECTFCHRSQVLEPPVGVAPPPPQPQPSFEPAAVGLAGMRSPTQPSDVASRTVGARLLFALVPLTVLILVGVYNWVSNGGGGIGGPDRSGSGPGSGGVVPFGERMQWGSSARGLLPVDIDGDGVEDFVGHYRVLDLSTENATTTEFIGGFDGKTFKRIWAGPSLGTVEQTTGSTPFGVAGGRVVVTDFRAQAHVLDLKTGKEVRLFALSDRAKSVCSPTDGKGEVWIEMSDDKHVLFDLGTGAAKLAPKPGWCAARQALTCTGHGFTGEPCAVSTDDWAGFQKLGISPDLVLRGDGPPIVVGNKTPGTPVALLIAYDPKTMAAVWQQPIAPDPAAAAMLANHPATFANGRVFTVYKTTAPAELHVTAVDAKTGKRVMDFKVPRGDEGSEPEEILVSPSRIYVPHWTWLDVFDAKDGHHLETVGMW